jgi:2,4-dienoyl-CoA reductase-like NADH-dependent reductase (Old Yellow Enzyme family)
MTYHKPASFKSAQAFQDYLQAFGIHLPFETEIEPAPHSPLAQPFSLNSWTIGNRFAVLPMEGWDGTPDGHPSELTFRRWQRFGLSGAKLVWGGEAVAVHPDYRANPNQLVINPGTLPDLARLRQELVAAHAAAVGETQDLVIGLQLTHSGRYARPVKVNPPRLQLAYDHPWLNPRVGLPDDSGCVLSDEAIDQIVEQFIAAAGLAQEVGFQFVDIKHCHGYLAHELLSAVDRPGKYGGSFENRTRFLRQVVSGIQARLPGMGIGVRFSAFDFIPFRKNAEGVGEPEFHHPGESYPYAFGGDGSGLGIDLGEPVALVDMLTEMGVKLVCITAGSPYYTPHIQRPAYFPPSDGYLPPEDPLLSVARLVNAAAQIKARCPQAVVVGSALSCLQEWLPNVAQAVVRSGAADFAGLGRMMLSYPQMPADLLAGRPMQRKLICRTFSNCTTAPRKGLVSGCFPLDAFYKNRPEAILMKTGSLGIAVVNSQRA